ncbi:hypothetical protein Pedsa_0875 [Pseudopedobacter saltans DSM 12145]|uniref:Uncharacterized protein n=1 Tax=Pseudopedobacter saltans (strain ATCC 51119 / DSM 12145 / JCM 21818 / CCUG 39354 / LMG 10337 / NBRC 100064 / NCIMB 13643) TaxID=762903 RepID=F0S9U1_PSESL|nr:hypothetical protein [Pseudopedobacter saltans]ADY51447.1 hypothetical protein Pedsa_0875 [Pseudopedobacter saltans DSM 12145]
MSNTPRPSRGTSGTAINVAQTVAAGPDQSPMNLPSINPGGVPLPANSLAATVQIVHDIQDLDGDEPDTSGFFYNDQNIFESGGLSKSDPDLFKRKRSGIKTATRTKAIAYIPKYGDIVLLRGEELEFLGYLGSVQLDPEELASFEPYQTGEYSEFFGKKSNFFKSLAAIAKKKGSNLALFRRKIKSPVSSFEGYEEVEYLIGSDPAESEFFGKVVRAIGKGIKKAGQAVGKAAKAVGRGVKNAVKATGKGIKNATKWTGKTVEKGADWLVNSAAKIMGNGPQEQSSPYETPLAWSQGTAAIDAMNSGSYAPSLMPYDEGAYQDESGQMIYPANSAGSPVQPKSNINLIIAIAIAVLIIGGLIIYKSKK